MTTEFTSWQIKYSIQVNNSEAVQDDSSLAAITAPLPIVLPGPAAVCATSRPWLCGVRFGEIHRPAPKQANAGVARGVCHDTNLRWFSDMLATFITEISTRSEQISRTLTPSRAKVEDVPDFVSEAPIASQEYSHILNLCADKSHITVFPSFTACAKPQGSRLIHSTGACTGAVPKSPRIASCISNGLALQR